MPSRKARVTTLVPPWCKSAPDRFRTRLPKCIRHSPAFDIVTARLSCSAAPADPRHPGARWRITAGSRFESIHAREQGEGWPGELPKRPFFGLYVRRNRLRREKRFGALWSAWRERPAGSWSPSRSDRKRFPAYVCVYPPDNGIANEEKVVYADACARFTLSRRRRVYGTWGRAVWSILASQSACGTRLAARASSSVSRSYSTRRIAAVESSINRYAARRSPS